MSEFNEMSLDEIKARHIAIESEGQIGMLERLSDADYVKAIEGATQFEIALMTECERALLVDALWELRDLGMMKWNRQYQLGDSECRRFVSVWEKCVSNKEIKKLEQKLRKKLDHNNEMKWLHENYAKNGLIDDGEGSQYAVSARGHAMAILLETQFPEYFTRVENEEEQELVKAELRGVDTKSERFEDGTYAIIDEMKLKIIDKKEAVKRMRSLIRRCRNS